MFVGTADDEGIWTGEFDGVRERGKHFKEVEKILGKNAKGNGYVGEKRVKYVRCRFLETGF